MYTKYIWGGQQTEMKILGKQNSTHPLKETFAAHSLLWVQNATLCKWGFTVQTPTQTTAKATHKACLKQPFISRYTSEKYRCKRCYQFCHTFSFSKSIPLSKQNWARFWLLSCEFSIHRVRGKKIILLLWWRRLARFDKLKSLQGAYWPWSSFISHSLSERDRKTLPHFSCEWVNSWKPQRLRFIKSDGVRLAAAAAQWGPGWADSVQSAWQMQVKRLTGNFSAEALTAYCSQIPRQLDAVKPELRALSSKASWMCRVPQLHHCTDFRCPYARPALPC